MTSDKPIPEHVLKAARRATVFHVLSLLNVTLARSGLTEATVAHRLGWPLLRLKRTLRGRRDPTLRDLAEIAWAMNGARLEFEIERTP